MLNSGDRYRKKSREARNRFLRLLVIVLIFSFISYKLGYENIKTKEEVYKSEINILHNSRVRLDSIIVNLRSDIQSSLLRYSQLEKKYNKNIPSGKLKKLYEAIEKQLNLGISFNRLNSIIKSSMPPKNCKAPFKRRFILKTNMYKGPHGEVSFANGAIRVTGNGETAINGKGKAEAWYDPGKEITIIFTVTGGKKIEKKGILPIYNSIIIDNKEYRFTISAGERSFIEVTSDSCDLY